MEQIDDIEEINFEEIESSHVNPVLQSDLGDLFEEIAPPKPTRRPIKKV